jgi:hypothetical protein
MEPRVMVVFVVVLAANSSVRGDTCSTPALTEPEILSVFHSDIEKRGGKKLDTNEWKLEIKTEGCNYWVHASVPNQRGAHFGILISRHKNIVRRYEGR